MAEIFERRMGPSAPVGIGELRTGRRREEKDGVTVISETVSSDPLTEAEFSEHGFIVVPQVLNPDECRQVLALQTSPPSHPAWYKSLATISPLFYQLGTHPRISGLVAQLIGEDVILWGALIIWRRPNQVHPFHSDLETVGQPGKTVSVWIGLQHTSQDSSLKLVRRSHEFGMTVQEASFKQGYRRGEPDDQIVLQWARECDPSSTIAQPAVNNGDAIVFDGRIWHASHNTNVAGTRAALLLQYATPETRIQVPVPGHMNWPVKYQEAVRPPVLLIRGVDRHGVNDVVSAPGFRPENAAFIARYVKPVELPLPSNPQTGFQPYPIRHGSTPCLREFENHVSVLIPNACPHPPHRHAEEEVLVMLDGEADLDWTVPNSLDQQTRHRIGSGDVVYYQSHHPHTIHARGPRPATYVIFKWLGDSTLRVQTELPTAIYENQALARHAHRDNDQPLVRSLLFEGPTRHLKKLHCHRSLIAPGAGYAPHRDPYDVAFIVLSGTVHILGENVGHHGIVFCGAGELHGMHNPGTEPAEYLVLEFHGHYYRPSLRNRIRFAFAHVSRNATRLPGKLFRVGRKLLGIDGRCNNKFQHGPRTKIPGDA